MWYVVCSYDWRGRVLGLQVGSSENFRRADGSKNYDFFANISQSAISYRLWSPGSKFSSVKLVPLSLSLMRALLVLACAGAVMAHSQHHLAGGNGPPCSLNGVYTDGKCVCDKPWKGEACEFMQLLPVTFPQGYGMPHSGLKNITTWGGNIIYDNVTKTHHLYVSRMSNDCNLVDYQTNSRIDHAVSNTGPTGPFTFHDVAIPTFSHNAAPIVLPDGTYAIYHVGAGSGAADGVRYCYHSHRTVAVLRQRCSAAVGRYDHACRTCVAM